MLHPDHIHIGIFWVFGIAAALMIAGCSTSSDGGSVLRSSDSECLTETSIPFRDDLTVAQAESLITANDGHDCFTILDVRTSSEFNAGHIPGAVKYDIYTDEFETALETLDKDNVYLVYCRSGNRSATAADRMHDVGFTAVFNMLGGFNDWKEADYPVEM